MEADMDFGVGKAIDLERIVLGNQKKIERLLRMGSNDSEIARLTKEIAALEIQVSEAEAARDAALDAAAIEDDAETKEAYRRLEELVSA